MRVVSNASVLIALAKLGMLDLLEKLFGAIIVPVVVFMEVTYDIKKPGAKILRKTEWITAMEPSDKALVNALLDVLDEGEANAIALAREINADLVLLDEKEARRVAKRLGLRIVGTLGILILAKRKGYLKLVRPLIDKLKKMGFRLSDEVIRNSLRLASEE